MIGVFSDWMVPLRIANAAGARVRPAQLQDLHSLDPHWQASPGVPVRYVFVGCDFLGLYQQPVATTPLNVTYVRAPIALVNAADVPEIPAEYHPRLVEYGVYRLRQAEGGSEFQKALPMLDSYLDGAQHYADYVRSRNKGARYDAVPFELRQFDRSKLAGARPDLLPLNVPPNT